MPAPPSLRGLLAAALAAAVVLPSVARAEVARFAVQRVEEGPLVDGRLDDAVWALAPVLDAFRQVEPIEGAAPSERTEVRIVTDGRALYFGVRCFDAEPSGIVALRLARDALLTEDDRLSIVISPFNDRRTGYLFRLNALGARRDGLVEDQVLSVEWDGIWNAKTRIDAAGWTLEMVVPFETLSFDPDNDVWGFNVGRTIRRRNEALRWTAVDQDLPFLNLATLGELTGMAGFEQGLGIDIVPQSSTRWVDEPQGSGGRGRSYVTYKPSLDVFYKPTPRVTSVLTVNTDFGETEVDTQQVNLTRFPLFFPEKRDFFLQDTGIFDFGGLTGAANGRPFFSRRIGRDSTGGEVDIRAGLKVTGRAGPLSFGLLDVQTEGHSEPDRITTDPGTGAVLEDGKIGAQNLSVVRATLNVLGESRIGFITTYGDQNERANTGLFGFDGTYRTSSLFGNRQLLGRLWFQRSETSGVDSGQEAYGAALEYPNDVVNWSLGYSEIGRNFDPALGRVARAAIRDYSGSLRLRRRFEGEQLRLADASTSVRIVTGLDDRLETVGYTLTPLRLESRIGDAVQLNIGVRHERLDQDFEIVPGVVIPRDRYDFVQASVQLGASGARPVSGSIDIGGGQFFSGHRLDVIPVLGWRPSAHWSFELSYRETQVWLPTGDFDVRLGSFRLAWQPTADIVWSTFLQWNAQTDALGVQSRLQWILTPGRELFLVFTQDVTDLDRDVRRGRTILLGKLGWTFRF